MANPRQRRKLKSGSSNKPSARAKRGMQKKLVRVPTIKGAKVIQDNWDPKLTVRQNYQKLGLIGNLSSRDSGGKEKENTLQASSSIPESVKMSAKLKPLMAKVQRDVDGKIIMVEETARTRKETAWGPALNSDENEAELEEGSQEDSEEEEIIEPNREVTDTLEALSKTITPVPRFTSQAEKTWLHRLVAKHGSNTSAMAHDRVDNIWQKTEGEIKRAIKKAGGIANLQE